MRNIQIQIKTPCIIFLRGDLAAGKTTFAKHILGNILGVTGEIKSPTYTYYNTYGEHYHFDLYRLKTYDEFFAIGGEDILDNLSGAALIEWPELLENNYSPDIEIMFRKTEKKDEREIEIRYHTKS